MNRKELSKLLVEGKYIKYCNYFMCIQWLYFNPYWHSYSKCISLPAISVGQRYEALKKNAAQNITCVETLAFKVPASKHREACFWISWLNMKE